MRTLEWEGDWPAGGRVSERARDAAQKALDSEAAPDLGLLWDCVPQRLKAVWAGWLWSGSCLSQTF